MNNKLSSDKDFSDLVDDNEKQAKSIQKIVGSEALTKSCMDCPFDYALRLRTGEVIAYESAEVINKEWIHITLKELIDQPEENRIAYKADRGMDIRLSDIVWVMDAPEGS